MRIQVRRNIFETNSSSEHSLTIMANDKYKLWKEGKLLARVKEEKESDGCWGNFWSRMYTLEFTDDFERAIKDNTNIIAANKERYLKNQEEYKKNCLSHKPTGDDYEDNYLYKFDEKIYNHWKEIYEKLDDINIFRKYIGLMHSEYWMTYDDFYKDYIEENDCYSPYFHEDKEHNVFIIGKYFHS